MEELSLEALRERFQHYDIRLQPQKYHLDYPAGVFRKASVLIPLFYRDGDYRVILTVRSKDLTHHAGYVAFPGGMKDDEDKDEIQTALREAEEEIGLDPTTVEIICVSGPGVVRPNSLAYPVIGLVPSDFQLQINETEVSMVFDVPLRRFLSKEGLEISDFAGPQGLVYHVHHFLDTVQGQEVDTWGFTAGFCVAAALVLYQSNVTFNMVGDTQIDLHNVFSLETTRKIIQSYITSNSAKL